MTRKTKEPKQSWLVTVRVMVEREIVTESCTHSEALESPYDYAVCERDIMQLDWEVTDVRPND